MDFLLQPTPRAEGAKNDLNRDAFLTLLVAQLKHQDPLDPMKDAEFISQLTGFSKLEQAIQTNQKLEELTLATAAQISAQAIDMVGRIVVVPGNTVNLPDEGNVEMKIDVPQSIMGGALEIIDEAGTVVRSIPLSRSTPGLGRVVWDGRDSDGVRLPAGNYSLRASGDIESGAQIELGVIAPARVDAVVWVDGLPQLRIGGRLVSLASVREVWRS
jgi:flagellar basal-body rod modification protein FlgD